MSGENEAERAGDEQDIPDMQVTLTSEELGILIGCCAYVMADMMLVDEYKQEGAALVRQLFPDLDASISETAAFDYEAIVGSRVQAVQRALLTKGREALEQEGAESGREPHQNLTDLVAAWCETFKDVAEARLSLIGPVLGRRLTENAGRSPGIDI